MRQQPTWRIPFGVLALVVGLTFYALVVVWASEWIGQWHIALQTITYLILGVAWLLPLRNFMIWMETGSWSPPAQD